MKIFFWLFFSVHTFFSSLECAHFKNIDAAAYRKPSSFDTKIVLPSAAEIKSRLQAIQLDHFVQTTNIDQRLGGRAMYPCGVLVTIEVLLCDYNKICQNELLRQVMSIRRPEIIATILTDFPQALMLLKSEEFLCDE